MKNYAIFISIVGAFICLLAGVLFFDLFSRVSFLEDFSLAQQYETKEEFVKLYGSPMCDLTDISDMQHYGPIKDESFLSGKTLCLFGYSLPPFRFIIVYFDINTNKKVYITWEYN